MGTEGRRARASLKDQLYDRPARFEFFQAVRLLQLIRDDRVSVGRDHDPDLEMVRFRSDLSYAFSPGDVRELHSGLLDEDGEPLPLEPGDPIPADEMSVNFLGVATPGSFGSLPTPYVEAIRRQLRDKNPAMRDFFDLFNHRITSLFYRAWERSRAEVLHELGERSAFESALRALIGIEGKALPSRLPLDPRDLLGRAGLLGMRPAPVVAIGGIIESIFGVRARIRQFLPTWYEIDSVDRLRLGQSNTTLGENANLGVEVCLAQYRFRVQLGPMDLAAYRALLPGTERYAMLSSVIRLAAGPEFEFEIGLALKKEEVPDLRLASGSAEQSDDDVGMGARLGWSSWLRTRPLERDAHDAVFTPDLSEEQAAEWAGSSYNEGLAL